MEVLKLLQKDLLTCTSSIFGFEQPHNFHVRISKLLGECTFAYLGADVIRSKPRNGGHEKALLSRIQSFILRDVTRILVAVEQD